ncbi:MAG: UvrB/UvrC motif-containing protein, partial [Clostridia bacterium]|nr:UvrB/UvrC motif-containing protein [Clostridia bacterium]
AGQLVEQLIRPTGLIDPEVEIHPIDGQIDDLISRINDTVDKKARVLVTTLTKKMAESLTAYLTERHIKVKYMHSDVDTLERVEIIAGLRRGEFDVLVGINLLREGLDIPEVQLVAILDADKEGFLRSETSLIQTIGRAARNAEAKVVMYADVMTDSMKRAIEETNRRREIQSEYNKIHGITPKTIVKEISNTLEISKKAEDKPMTSQKDISRELARLTSAMKVASANLDFELAIKYREQIASLKLLLKK